jgi:hypothetical protein
MPMILHPGRFRLISLGACAALALAACATPPAGSPPPSAQTDLFEVEATYTGAISAAGAYLALPACGSPGASKVCSDGTVAGKITLAATTAAQAMSGAETLVLGCPLAQYVASTATPPTATCGIPVADQTAQQQALTAVQTAIAALTAAIPIITATGATAP